MALDYRSLALKADGKDVGWVRVTGILVEAALVFTQKWGLGSLAEHSLPQTVSMTLDHYAGERPVLTHPEDRALACHLAKGLRCQEHAMGLAQLAARVPALSDGRRVSDHDQIVEVVDGPPVGRLSVELKVRSVRDAEHRRRLRDLIRGDADSDWWRAIKGSGVAPWSGRMVVLIPVPTGNRQAAQTAALASPVVTYCDVLMNWTGAQWRGVWGWPGSAGMATLRRPQPLQPSIAVAAKALPAAKAAPAAKATPAPRPGNALAKLPWDRVLQELRPHFIERRGTQMASVPMLLALLKVPRSKKQNLARDLARWKKIHGWTITQIDQCKRKGPSRKPGGSAEAVATQEVLRILYGKY